jgi:hypothetical protein
MKQYVKIWVIDVEQSESSYILFRRIDGFKMGVWTVGTTYQR